MLLHFLTKKSFSKIEQNDYESEKKPRYISDLLIEEKEIGKRKWISFSRKKITSEKKEKQFRKIRENENVFGPKM